MRVRSGLGWRCDEEGGAGSDKSAAAAVDVDVAVVVAAAVEDTIERVFIGLGGL